MLRYAIIAFAMVAGGLAPVAAQDAYVLTAKGSEGLIKAYDPVVRDVSAVIPARPGSSTACGTVGDGNLTAFYCPQSRSIYINKATLVSVGNAFGLEGIAALTAHEFAHARQHAVQGFTRDIVWSSVIDEVQADCVAGVYMRRATPISLTDKMVSNAARFLEYIGDYLPLEKDWHGTPEMRKQSFLLGYREGRLSTCAASNETNLNKIIQEPTEVIRDQIKNPSSELNRLMRWGSDMLKN